MYTEQNLLCRTNLYPKTYQHLRSEYPDLVPKRNLQLQLMGNLELQSGVLWLRIKTEDKCAL